MTVPNYGNADAKPSGMRGDPNAHTHPETLSDCRTRPVRPISTPHAQPPRLRELARCHTPRITATLESEISHLRLHIRDRSRPDTGSQRGREGTPRANSVRPEKNQGPFSIFRPLLPHPGGACTRLHSRPNHHRETPTDPERSTMQSGHRKRCNSRICKPARRNVRTSQIPPRFFTQKTHFTYTLITTVYVSYLVI